MKSDSLIKATASLLALSLLATTCFTTVSEAAGGSHGISSQNPVTVSALMMQSLNSKTYKVIVAEAENEKKAEVASAKTTSVVQNQTKSEQSEKTVQNANEKNTEAKAKTVGKNVKKVSRYAHTAIAIEDVVNIRKSANTTASIVGRLYKGSAATIVATKGDWVYVKSGNVKGYIKKNLLAIGEAAEKIAAKYVKKYAVVNTTTLNVREKASTDAKILVQVGQDEVYRILKGYPEWLKIRIDAETDGYITRDDACIKIVERFTPAISEEERLAQLNEDQEETVTEASNDNSKSDDKKSNNKKKATKKKKTTKKSSKKKSSSKSKKTVSAKGNSIASFALQFVGNPYRYGGTSLTNGTDCSGFTQSVYRNYGYSISRTSGSQYSSAGRIVSMNSLQAGDLLFYKGSGGSVNHVAMYIGGGKVVHASNPRDGIKVSSYNYRTPVRARRIMN